MKSAFYLFFVYYLIYSLLNVCTHSFLIMIIVNKDNNSVVLDIECKYITTHQLLIMLIDFYPFLFLLTTHLVYKDNALTSPDEKHRFLDDFIDKDDMNPIIDAFENCGECPICLHDMFSNTILFATYDCCQTTFHYSCISHDSIKLCPCCRSDKFMN